jgi:hypothetical protein
VHGERVSVVALLERRTGAIRSSAASELSIAGLSHCPIGARLPGVTGMELRYLPLLRSIPAAERANQPGRQPYIERSGLAQPALCQTAHGGICASVVDEGAIGTRYAQSTSRYVRYMT